VTEEIVVERISDEEFWRWFEAQILKTIKGSNEEDFRALLPFSVQPENTVSEEERESRELVEYLRRLSFRREFRSREPIRI